MKNFILILFLSLSFFTHAQVGVGTINPKAKLHVKAAATPTNTDGVLIPSMDNFPTPTPTADQDGMLIFITGNGTPQKGFYFWDNSGTAQWVNLIDSKQKHLIPFVTRAELDAITTPENGQVVYDSTDAVTLMWNGSNWIVLSDTCFPQPSTANAGNNQIITTSALTATLTANTPTEGTGTWSVVSPTGTVTSFADIHDPNTTFTGEGCTGYSLKWTITTACAASEDFVSILFYEAPTTANAGPHQTFTDATTSTVLDANIPSNGTGTWYINITTIGTTTNFSDIHDPQATFTGNPCTTYNLYWYIEACSITGNAVQIQFNEQPTTANAGSTIYSLNSTTVTLNANSATVGTGTWSIVSGGTGTFSNINDPQATFTADNNNSHYVLQWSIVACNTSTSTVDVLIGNVIGQNAYGGVIFYVDGTGNHGLVCATVEATKPWACTNTNITTGTAIGSGQTNTANIVTDQTTCADFGAKYCNDLVYNGFSDWFMPSSIELQQLYVNRNSVNTSLQAIGGTLLSLTGTSSIYWSSSQANSTYARYRRFSDGYSASSPKINYFKVRPIRAF